MSSSDSREDRRSALESERTALAGLPPGDPLRLAAVGRLQRAWSELRGALFVLDIDSVDQWLATRVELEVLFKAMAWDHWCPHHLLRTQCPADPAAHQPASAADRPVRSLAKVSSKHAAPETAPHAHEPTG